MNVWKEWTLGVGQIFLVVQIYYVLIDSLHFTVTSELYENINGCGLIYFFLVVMKIVAWCILKLSYLLHENLELLYDLLMNLDS